MEIAMQKIPPRPVADEAMILAACAIVAKKLDDADAETIAKHYSRHMDGFELAKELDKYASWDTTRDDMEALDEVDYLVDSAERAEIKAWAAEHNPQPPFPVGTRITKGMITGVSDYSPACYEVKEDGDEHPNRRLIIKFEHAVAA